MRDGGMDIVHCLDRAVGGRALSAADRRGGLGLAAPGAFQFVERRVELAPLAAREEVPLGGILQAGVVDAAFAPRACRELKQRGINYSLIEDEGFAGLVNGPADLRDDAKWETTLRRAREVYRRAKELVFRGLAMDAEDYAPPSDKAVIEKYSQIADHVDCWTFHDEFGYSGCYYQRGLQFGRVIKEVWDCPVIQYYLVRRVQVAADAARPMPASSACCGARGGWSGAPTSFWRT